jgi:thiamine monophosphate synthase
MIIHVDLFFNDNLFMINKYLKEYNKDFFKWYDNILDNDLRLLFQIQYFVKYLNESKYQRQLIKLKKLIKKYYNRLLIYF